MKIRIVRATNFIRTPVQAELPAESARNSPCLLQPPPCTIAPPNRQITRRQTANDPPINYGHARKVERYRLGHSARASLQPLYNQFTTSGPCRLILNPMYPPASRLPNFFLVGAPKTGTTSLCNYLRQHPEIYISPVKEPCYFASEMRAGNFTPPFASSARLSSRNLLKYIEGPMSGPSPGGIVSDGNEYRKLFKNVGVEKAIGEASVCYLWSPTAPANIHAQVPEAKIVVILRDPVERAFSQYLQYAASGLLTSTFRQHIERCLRNTDPAFGPLRPFLEYGLYYHQLKRYLDAFSSARVRIYFYEEAWQSPSSFLQNLFCFLGVDPQFPVDTSVKDLERRAPKAMPLHYLFKKSGLTPATKKLLPPSWQASLRSALFKQKPSLQLAPQDRLYMIDYYRDDIQKLSSLVGRDFSAWLT